MARLAGPSPEGVMGTSPVDQPARRDAPLDRLSGVQRAVLAEAQVVAPWIDDVERALAPRPGDRVRGGLAVDLVRREDAEPRGARVDRVEVGHREVQRL